MARLGVATLLLLGGLGASGCGALDWLWGTEVKPEYCAAHPEDRDCPDAGDTGRCFSNATCMAPTAVCDVSGTMTCVQCVAPSEVSACTGITPACGADHACHACSKHEDCPASDACLPDGSCAVAAQVAYVEPVAGAGSQCTQAMPCKKVSDGLSTMRPYVKLTGMIDEAVIVNGGRVVTFLSAPSTTLTRTSGSGAVLEVRDDSTSVSVYDLQIRNGVNNPAAVGCALNSGMPSLKLARSTVTGNAGIGIQASGGTLTISRSTISLNTTGGISISGAQFDITNTFIVNNGGPASTFGGIKLDSIGAGSRRLDFNTIADNQGKDGLALGVFCVPGSLPMTFSNNIVYENQVGGTRTQVGGADCSWTYSDIGDTVAGTGNISAPPMFVDATQNNFHIKSTSPAHDAADPAATLTVDFDGEVRPQGTRSDMGADEWHP